MKKLLGLLMLFAFAAVMAHAVESVSDEGTAKAKIIQAATLQKGATDLDFGTIVADTDGGTVAVTAAKPAERNPQNIQVVTASAFSAGEFELSNLDTDTTYSVSVDPSVNLQKSGATDMSATLTLSDDTVHNVTSKKFYVGGTLTVNGNQTAGQYEGHYNVTVTY